MNKKGLIYVLSSLFIRNKHIIVAFIGEYSGKISICTEYAKNTA